MSAKTKRARVRAEPLRKVIGLDAAMSGDTDGVYRFLFWIEAEVSNIALFGGQPQRVSDRLRYLSRDLKQLSEFADGYATALKAKQ